MNEPAATTVTHTAALLAQPVCGSPAVALLEAGTIVQGAQAEHGFVLLQDPSGLAGYLPAALLGAAPAERSPSISVTHSATLFRSASIADTFGTRPIVARDEIVLLHERAGDFVKIARADGQAGFLPAALCQPLAGQPQRARAVQAVALYSSPTPGGQYGSEFQIEPGEPLIELGRSGKFALVQRREGQIGFVLAALCGTPTLDAIMPAGPLDLGWLVIGMFWWLINWAGAAAMLEQVGLAAELRRYAGLALLIGITAALWLIAHRRVAARSLTLGAIGAHALLYLAAR
jgi:hypothetical protein